MLKRLIIHIERKREEEIENLLILNGFSTKYYVEEKGSEVKIEIYEEEERLREIEKLLRDKVKDITISSTIKIWKSPKKLLPYELTEGVIINPSPNSIIINLIPGMAFGTGLHESTKIAAKLLKSLNLKERDVLDVGCGSGILSVLAKKLGASRVVAVDNEPQAIEKTRETAILNQVEVEILLSDITDRIKDKFDIVVANILPPVLERLLFSLREVIREGGKVIFSGIYVDEYTSMKKSIINHNFKIEKEEVLNEWYGFLFKQ